MQATHLPTPYQELIHKSRYARWLETEGRRENLPETIDRYLDFMDSQITLDSGLRSQLFNAIYNLDVMPSMRAMMTSGEALKRDNTAGFNCSYLEVDSTRSFDEAMFILLCGTGVGFSVEQRCVSQLPVVPVELVSTNHRITVADSKEGWATAYRKLIEYLYSGIIPKWNTDLVRPAGARLKTFGGRASGPQPLIDLFEFTIKVFLAARGRQLRTLECHDIMCKIGDVVVVGGVRRSAMISLSDLNDTAMASAKSFYTVHGYYEIDAFTYSVTFLDGYGDEAVEVLTFKDTSSDQYDLQKMKNEKLIGWYRVYPSRGLANNSAVYLEKPNATVFLKEWHAMVASMSGERGIFSRAASEAQAMKNGRRGGGIAWGTNPCCVSGDTLILTSEGYQKIIETVGKPTTIWNGEGWEPVVPYAAGIGDLFHVVLSDGTSLDCTHNHRWVVKGGEFVETAALEVGQPLEKFDMPILQGGGEPEIDAYSQGFYSGDGCTNQKHSYLYEPKFCCESRLIGKVTADADRVHRKRWIHGDMLPKDYVPLNVSHSYRLQWLAGLLDADGTVTHDSNGSGFQIASIDVKFLTELRLMLTTLGVKAKICSGNGGECVRPTPDGRGGSKDYLCKETRRLLIGNSDAASLIAQGLSLSRLQHNGSIPQRDARRFVTIESVTLKSLGEMTFCFTEPKTSRGTFNGIVTGNSEIIMRPNQFCNLSEVVARAKDTLSEMKEKVRLATILGTYQSGLTNFPYLRDIWRKNTEEERLLGVSLTGIMDHPVLNGSMGKMALEMWLTELKRVAIETNAEFAALLGISCSVAITCVKPSGTVSQLTDSASGIHTRHSPYYIRTIRQDMKDPVTAFLIAAGVPHEPCNSKPQSTMIFSFPVKAPEGALTRNDVCALDQLDNWLTYQRYWCEHKPSCTVSVRDDEWMQVGAWVFENFDELSGISFLPLWDHVYQQAPYQEVDFTTYHAALEAMPKDINWNDLAKFEFEDNTVSSQTLACVGASCEI